MANPLSPISYTNKDFNSIYEEILTLAKQLSEKWDPTVSNESDPGVVLLKTDAIIGDKNNYNIDKNILEAFPQTVTQDVNARNMYKQLAYYMPWYRSSETVVTVKYLGEPLLEGEEFQIPAYTMVCNSDSNVVYTLTQPLTFNYTTNSTTSNAIEGTINDLRVNGSNTITLENLDVNNRVYFDDYSVAENGIFIVNVNSQDKRPWKRVDNLFIQPLNTKCFEFGVDSRTETCYIEFPQDIANLIESGLSIKYILSNGSLGNVAAQTLEKFYQETTVELNGNPLPLNNENFKLANFSAAVSGSDPQSIADAYLSYKKQATLLNTLVTTQDYANALYNSGLVSNVIVSDRTNDLQTSYIVMTDDKVNPEHLYQLRLEDMYSSLIEALKGDPSKYFTKSGEDFVAVSLGQMLEESLKTYSRYISEPLNAMNAFDLKLYLLQNSGTISNIQQYENTFELIPIEFTSSPVYNQISNFISNQKCIQHDFKQLLVDTPCMYQNSYPIIMKVVPTGKLTEAQISELKVNIIKSLYNVTSAHYQEFGVEPDYDLIYNTIKNSDERIQTLILDDFRYTTYAVYWDSSAEEFKRIPINTTELDATNMVVEISDIANLANYKGKTNEGWNTIRLNSTLFLYTSDEIDTNNLTGSDDYLYYGDSTSIKKNTIFIFDSTLNKFIIYSDKLSEFQKDLIVKSIMAGITPLYIPNTDFNISLSDSQILQTDTGEITTVSVISPYATENEYALKEVPSLGNIGITVPNLPESTLTTDKYASTYTMKDNENIRLFGPSFTSEKVFANYAKFILQLNPNSGVTRYNPILLSSDLQSDKTYYTTLEGWQNIAKNAIEFYNQRFDTKYGAPDTSLYTVLTKWVGSICEFLGIDIEDFDYMTTTYSNDSDDSTEPPEGVVFPDRPSIVEFTKKNNDTYSSIVFTFTTSVTENIDNNINTITYNKTVTFDFCEIQISGYTGGTWTYNESNYPYSYSGRLMVDYVTSGSTITQNIDPYDPIIASFNQKLDNPNINEISVFDQVTTYTIPAETEYQLKENESITFFWRESDGDDVPYRYQRYVGISKNSETSTKKSPILKSTFALKGEPISSSFLDSLSSSGELLDGAPGWDEVVRLYGDNDLSGSRSIDIRKINQVVLDRTNEGTYQNKNKIYFITNTNINDEYHLEIPLVSTSTVESKTTYSYRYTLQDNEFFIYTMDNGTSFEMLSAGTLIGIDTQTDRGSSISFDVDAVSTEDIVTKGISSFLAKTEYIPQDYTMFCREQKIYSIVGGDEVHFNIEDLDTFLEANKGVNKLYPQNSTTGVPYFCTWADTYVKGFSMNYTSSGTEITLPRLEIQDDNDCIWVGRSYLNVRTSPQKAQEIIAAANKSTQSIIIDGTVYPNNTTNGGPSNGFESPAGEVLKIRSSIDLDKVGGENVDLTYLDMLGERNNVSLYLYETLSAYTDDPYYITDNNVVEVRMNAGDLTKYTRIVSFKYESSDRFIFSIMNTSKKCSFKLYITTEENNTLSDAWIYNLSNRSDSSEFLGEGIYYFDLPQDTTQISFEFSNTEDNFEILSSEPNDWSTDYENYYILNGDTFRKVQGTTAPTFETDTYYKLNDTETLKISPLEKATLNSVFNEYSIDENIILDAIKSYDYLGLFKYNYIPDNEVRILDPLKSNTFFELQHVANKYTMPKCVLKISSASDSKISIVNNR